MAKLGINRGSKATGKQVQRVSSDNWTFEFNAYKYMEQAESMGLWHLKMNGEMGDPEQGYVYKADRDKVYAELQKRWDKGEAWDTTNAPKAEKPKTATAKKAKPAKAEADPMEKVNAMMALAKQFEEAGYSKDMALETARIAIYGA